jgi:type IV pilus assembly protein PilB
MISLPKEKLKRLLVSEEIVSSDDFDTAYKEAERKEQNVTDILISKGLISKSYFYTLLAKSLGVEIVHLSASKINEEVMRLIPQEVARSKRAVVFDRSPDGSFSVAMEDPTNLEAIDFLTLQLGAPVKPFLVADADLESGFLLYERRKAKDFASTLKERIAESVKVASRGNVEDVAKDVPIVSLLETLVSYAASSHASDIHFEALEDTVLVRYRIDGVMREIARIPKEVHPVLVARIKILAGLRVDEHSHPQDGRFRHMVGGSKRVDVRVSIIPTFSGEKAVLRLLSSSGQPLSFSDLGMLEDQASAMEQAIKKSYGMVLICGPTGSGKTTTLYSVLNTLNRPEVNIVTIEDPIEYNVRYINQIQVNPRAGITFASGLRSILRQDPNVIMVGEIRDGDTANISVQAALTGHLVLSSLHTNDAPTAVPRLFDMGIPPFLVAAVLSAISSQRLVRKIHTDCIESEVPDEKLRESISDNLKLVSHEKELALPKTIYRGKGCPACGNTGYSGRVGIFETLVLTDNERKLIIQDDFSLDQLRASARESGMISMVEDGMRKVERGITTIEELLRVIRA